MRNLIAIILLSCYLAGPAFAQAATAKDPLGYPLKHYGFMVAIAIFGGLVNWYAKVRKGELAAWNLMQLVGELATSAFAGLIAFWVCEYMNSPPLLTASLVGIAGHMGTRAIQAFESFAAKRWAPPPTPLDPPTKE